MKHLITIVAAILAFSAMTFAQDEKTEPGVYAVVEHSHDGTGAAEAGKVMMFTGASFAMTGIVVFVAGALTFRQNPDTPTTPLYPVFAIGAGAIGAAVALVGLPFYLAGKSTMESNGSTFLNVGVDSKPGMAGIMEIGLGIPNCVNLDALCGYNFNSRFFLGGGLGYRADLTHATGGTTASVPIYAQARYTIGNKKSAPYAALSLGYDAKNTNLYSGLEFGVRMRSMKKIEKGSSCWLGTKFEMPGIISFKFGKSF